MPDQTRQQQIKDLLLDALEHSAETREAFVSAVAPDSAMRAEILKLIDDHERAGGFLNGSNTPEPSGETSASRLPPSADQPGVLIDRYELVELIGEGGFGRVFLAQQRSPVQREVALKIIKLGMDTRQVVARFEAERQALAMMEHPGIARVIDGGATDSGRPYFVMELVRGVPITIYCDEHGRTIAERLDLFIQVCSAVQHAHT